MCLNKNSYCIFKNNAMKSRCIFYADSFLARNQSFSRHNSFLGSGTYIEQAYNMTWTKNKIKSLLYFDKLLNERPTHNFFSWFWIKSWKLESSFLGNGTSMELLLIINPCLFIKLQPLWVIKLLTLDLS